MADSEAAGPVKLPTFSPDCLWIPMTPGSPVPENVLYLNGELEGNKVHIGRVYDQMCAFVGTAIPEKGTCIYLDKNLNVKSSNIYEILAVGFGDPLWFIEEKASDEGAAYYGGMDENKELLYIGRHIDSKFNTYYGWVDLNAKTLYIPRDSSEGPQVIDKDFGILIHRNIHMMCTGCPVPEKGVHYF